MEIANTPQGNTLPPDTTQSEQPSFGMKLVGISFNPSGDAKVNKAKELCAQLAELINETPKEG